MAADAIEEGEAGKIAGRLDDGESVVVSARQSRVRPGGGIINPKTIFATQRRVIIRTPTRLGLGEDIEEYFYRQITNVRLERGVFSAELVFTIPGMTELSKDGSFGGGEPRGIIEALPKVKAEKIYEYVRERIAKAGGAKVRDDGDDPLRILRARYARGEITKEVYKEMRDDLS